MKTSNSLAYSLCLGLISLTACIPSTGGQLVSFTMAASGPADVVKGQPYQFTNPEGFTVSLTRAQLFVGAVYLNQNNSANYQLEPACILPGIYSGEVRGSLTVDALDPAAQPFPVKGNGTDAQTLAGELWLSSGDVQAETDAAVVLDVAGTASQGTMQWPFDARFTIGENRKVPPRDPALPGTNPLCKQRIVSPIAASLVLADKGTLRLRIDPKRWFDAVDFSQLKVDQQTNGIFHFIDDTASSGQPDTALYNGLRTNRGPYGFEFENP